MSLGCTDKAKLNCKELRLGVTSRSLRAPNQTRFAALSTPIHECRDVILRLLIVNPAIEMANKEATIYIVDVGKSMGRKQNGRVQTNLEWSMQYVWDKITTTVSTYDVLTACFLTIGRLKMARRPNSLVS